MNASLSCSHRQYILLYCHWDSQENQYHDKTTYQFHLHQRPRLLQDHYLHAFTYPEWKHVVSFGKRGEAPEEMLSAENIQFNSLDSLWTLDANKMEITRWKITPSTGSAERVEEIKLNKKLVRSLDFYAMESGFLIPDYLGEHRFWEVDNNGQPLQSKGKIPSETADKEISRPALAQARGIIWARIAFSSGKVV